MPALRVQIPQVNAVPKDGFANTALPAHADLVLSTFAYSEVSLPNRSEYFDKIVKAARRGFIADNSGWTGAGFGGFSRGALPTQLLMAGHDPRRLLVFPENVLRWNNDPNAALVLFGADYAHSEQALADARARAVRGLKPGDLATSHYPVLKLLPCDWLHYGAEVRLCGAGTERDFGPGTFYSHAGQKEMLASLLARQAP